MKEQIMNEVLQRMLPYLDNAQAGKLQEVLEYTLEKYVESRTSEDNEKGNDELIQKFIEAKRIEGCSEKTLTYYQKTIEDVLTATGKEVMHITTEDLRRYLTSYQTEKHLSKVTVDNVRRILSSFFSWMEDEDYILKSPVRRIHKVKTAATVKDTYTDEALEVILNRIEANIPEYNLQIKVASILSALDAKIKENKRININLFDQMSEYLQVRCSQ